MRYAAPLVWCLSIDIRNSRLYRTFGGDPSIKKNVTIDGASHPVTVNLESALRDLRYPSHRKTIWADAICINQVDLIEKNHQIPLMGDIYRKASGVVAYLGHPNPYLELFVDWSHAYSRKWPLLGSGRWIRMTLRSWISQKGVREKDMLSLQTYLGLLEFISHPYFSRIWTFQEFLLPSRRPIFVIGKKSFQINHISSQTWQNLYTRHFKTLRKALRRLPRATGSEAQEFMNLCLARLAIVYDLSVQLVFMGDILARVCEWELLSLITMTNPRKCFDPRDKIFALHPFLQELVPGICAPDYRKSLDDVLFETLSKIYQHAPSFIRLFIIYWPLRGSSVEDASGPTWLPDITETHYPFSMSDRTALITLRISEDFLVLTLGARGIGKCHPSLMRLGSEPGEILRRIAEIMYSGGEDPYSFAGSEIKVRKKRNLSERIFYALHAWSHIREFQEDIQESLSILSTIAQYKSIRKLDDIPFTARQRKHLPILTITANDFANKTFFWTDTGLFGTCSGRLQEGDTIMIISELPGPFAVRTRLDPSGEPNHYYMVCRVFVDGIEGTARDAQLISEIQETPLNDIYIH